MSGAARTYVCDNGHKFGVTCWGTPPLACPRCRAQYKEVRRGGRTPRMNEPAGRGGRKPPTAPMAIALKEPSR